MTERLNQFWRALATGICFAVFGLGQLFEALLIFPLLILFTPRRERRQLLGKRLMQLSFKSFVELMRLTGVLSYRTVGLERLNRPGLLILANHPTLIDVVFLISFLRRADCIVKDALIKNPFTRFAILAAGLTPNSGGGDVLLERCIQSMNSGNALVIFPEGRRSAERGLTPFQRGASHIAVRARRNITPIVIRVGDHNLGRSSKWWQAPRAKVNFVFEVKEDIEIEPFLQREPEAAAAARDLTQFLNGYFMKELELYGNS